MAGKTSTSKKQIQDIKSRAFESGYAKAVQDFLKEYEKGIVVRNKLLEKAEAQFEKSFIATITKKPKGKSKKAVIKTASKKRGLTKKQEKRFESIA